MNKDYGEVGLGEDEKLLCIIQSHLPRKQLDPGLPLLKQKQDAVLGIN